MMQTIQRDTVGAHIIGSDDLIDLTWFDFEELAKIKMTPPAYTLFDRVGTDWLKI